MKVSRIYLKDFKRFKEQEILLRNNLTDAANQFLFLGDNGTGKTSILQAVALCLSMVSGRIRSVSEFNWQGWVPGRYERWGKPLIEMDVHFSDEEIAATIKAAEKWLELKKPRSKVLPAEHNKLTLRLNGEWCEALDEKGKHSNRNLFQLKGRYYASHLIRTFPWIRDYFKKLPGYFWFDQFRNLSIPMESGYFENDSYSLHRENGSLDKTGRVSYDIGAAQLRRYLNAWKLRQLAGYGLEGEGTDWLLELENIYKKVFPGRSFRGLEPMHKDGIPAPADYYFTLHDGSRSYDIEEMSAGEQSVFPMLFEFVRLQIGSSIVMIDEVDLNLHPPLAQSLINTLPSLGIDCQFLLTTHSESVSSLFGNEEICRLQGGRLCL